MAKSALTFILDTNVSVKDELKILAQASWINFWETVQQLDNNLFRRAKFQYDLHRLQNYEKFTLNTVIS